MQANSSEMDSEEGSQVAVEVMLELGHTAVPRKEPLRRETQKAHTHDWHLWVRGVNGSKVQHFVEKVVFFLHDSFPNPVRVLDEPPYEVKATCYASFELMIDVYFRNNTEPKMINFEYDMFIDLEKPINKLKREKLTFNNPCEEFMKKLVKGGGQFCNTPKPKDTTATQSRSSKQTTSVTSTTSTNSKSSPERSSTSRRERASSNKQQTSTSTTSSNSNATSANPSAGSGVGGGGGGGGGKENKLSKNNLLINTATATATLVSNTTSVPDSQFTDLFGPPIQTTRVTSESTSALVSASPVPNSPAAGKNKSKSKSSKNGNQSKSKSATSRSNAKPNSSSSHIHQSEFKSTSAPKSTGTSSTTSTSCSSSTSVRVSGSAKSEHTSSSKYMKTVNEHNNDHGDSKVPFSSSSVKQSKKSSTKEHSSFNASLAKKDSSFAKTSHVDASKGFAQDKPSKKTKSSSYTESQLFASSNEDISKKFKSKKDKSKEQSNSKVKVKLDEGDDGKESKKHKSKPKDKNRKKDKKRKKETSSSEESESEEFSESPSHDESSKISKLKIKRRRRQSNSSNSSLAEENRQMKDEPSYFYQQQEVIRGMVTHGHNKLHPGSDTFSERVKPKWLADSTDGHFPALLHSAAGKLSQSSNSLLATAASFTAHVPHSPILSSSPMSCSSSPSQKVISSKSNPHLHEDSNRNSNGASGPFDSFLGQTESSSSSSKKQSKISKDVLNSSESSQMTSTKIRYRHDQQSNVTTIEIKSVKEEKTWDSNEVKRLKTSKESSKSSLSKLLPVSGKNAEQTNLADETCGNSMQDNKSSSNSLLSSVSSNTNKRSKQSNSFKKKDIYDDEDSDLENRKRAAKKSSKFGHDSDKKGIKKRDHSLSSVEDKMPPPPLIPPAHSKYLVNDTFDPVIAKTSQLNSQRYRSQSPALSLSSSSSEVASFKPSSKKQRLPPGDEQVLAAKGSRKQKKQSHGKLGSQIEHDSDFDRDEDDEEDKMSIASTDSSSSVSSSSSSMSISSAGSFSVSSRSSAGKKSGNSKTKHSKVYTQKNHSKSSIKQSASASITKKHRSTSKLHVKEKKPTKSSKSNECVASSSEDSDSESELSYRDSDSGSDRSDNEHHSHHQSVAKFHTGGSKAGSLYSVIESEEEMDNGNKTALSYSKSSLLSPPTSTKGGGKGGRSQSPKETSKMFGKCSTNQSAEFAKKSGHSLLTPVSNHSVAAKSQSVVSSKANGKSCDLVGSKHKRSTTQKRGGYLGLSDSSNEEDNDDNDDDQNETTQRRSNKNAASLYRHKQASNSHHKKDSSAARRSKGSDGFDLNLSSASSDSSDSEKKPLTGVGGRRGASDISVSNNTNNNGGQQQHQEEISPSPNSSSSSSSSSRLPIGNIYSKAGSIHSPLDRNTATATVSSSSVHCIGSDRNSSRSPSGSRTPSDAGGGGGGGLPLAVPDLTDLQYRIHRAGGEMLQRLISHIERRNLECFQIVENTLQFNLIHLDVDTLLELKAIIG